MKKRKEYLFWAGLSALLTIACALEYGPLAALGWLDSMAMCLIIYNNRL